MKKYSKLAVLFVLIALISGCGKDGISLSKEKELTCTNTTTDEDGYKNEDKMVVTYKDNKVVKVTETNVTETDPSMLDMTYSFTSAFAESFNKVDGMNITYSKEGNNKLKFVMIVDYDKIDVDSLKNTLGDLYDEDNFYNKKDITIDEFKENNLKDYTCK